MHVFQRAGECHCHSYTTATGVVLLPGKIHACVVAVIIVAAQLSQLTENRQESRGDARSLGDGGSVALPNVELPHDECVREAVLSIA